MLSSYYQIKEPKNPAFTQIITRSGVFSGISFKKTKESDIKKTNYLSSVPNISFSFDYSTVIFDYGETSNKNDQELINSLFNKLTAGTVFSITQANFLIEDQASAADLSGTYSFIRLVGNSVIASPVSVTSINDRITIYQNKYFLSIPQIGTSISAQSNFVYYTIVNSLLSDKKSSFTNFGIYPNDFLKITGSVNNDKIYKVSSVLNNSDGSETLIVENEITDEICFGTPLTFQLIQTGPYTLSGLQNNSDNIVGSCTLTFTDNVSSCYRNHTENQCSVRGAEKNSVSATWVKGAQCKLYEQSLTQKITPVPAFKPSVKITDIGVIYANPISNNNLEISQTDTKVTSVD